MPSLQEIYDLDVELHGEDSESAKTLKRQMENAASSEGQSAERLFMAGAGPKLQEMNN